MPRLLALAVILIVAGLITVAFRSGKDGPAGAVALDDSAPEGGERSSGTSEATVAPSTTGAGEASTAETPPTGEAPEPPRVSDIPNQGPHPDLVDIDGWLQSDVTSLEELQGRVVVVQFWTFGCFNCKNTLPNLIDLYSRYDRDQVEIVGVHAPEFAHEEDPANVSAAAEDLGVTWPIALDTQKRSFHLWQEGTRAYWPRTYVLDREGNIRFDHIGEGGYDDLNETVAALVADPAA